MEVPWFIGTIIGGASLALMNSMKRSFEMTLPNFCILFPLLVITQLGFWYGFRHGYSFIVSWYVGSGMSAISAILITVFWFHEPIAANRIVGMILIILGQFVLVRGVICKNRALRVLYRPSKTGAT